MSCYHGYNLPTIPIVLESPDAPYQYFCLDNNGTTVYKFWSNYTNLRYWCCDNRGIVTGHSYWVEGCGGCMVRAYG